MPKEMLSFMTSLTSGQGPAAGKTPMAERDEYQWILKPNTKYGLVLENTGGETIKFLEVVWVWYRENG